MTDMAENMKAAMDLIYLVSCAVNEEKPDAEKCAATAILPVNATESYIRGDANGDGVVSIGDVTAIQRHLAELEHLNSDRIKAGDVTGEGLDISDATAIQMYLAEYENTYKIGETVIYDEYELPFIPVK